VNTELTFNTHGGTEIAATFTAPSGRGVFPAVLLCQGLSGVRHLVLPRIAEGLAERGFASLRFDYAGHGESGGPRGLIDPFARVVDGRYALATLLTLGEVDSDRVGVYGHSYGGPIAIQLAAQERRARALVAVSSPGSGLDMLRASRPEWDWIALMKRVDAERAAVAGGAPPTIVDLETIFPFSPKFAEAYAKLKTGGTSAKVAGSGLGVSQFDLASVDRMIAFDPESAARNLVHCPTLLVHGEDDDTAPMSTVAATYRAIPGPKHWHSVPKADHNALDTEPLLTSVLTWAGDWFARHLSPADTG
jgi:pimeloyl-ACP methyl ester carboxylesterase